jgi:hypothetical protein
VLGAGDVLAAPLGAALTAVGFLIYKHRAALALPAIAATAALSAAFSVATSVAAAKVLGVSTGEDPSPVGLVLLCVFATSLVALALYLSSSLLEKIMA